MIIRLFFLFVITAVSYSQSKNGILISIDHVNVAVNDLRKAEEFFKSIGFTVKPGRFHENSIQNIHLKFRDGTEIEYISASKPLDELAKKFIKLKSEGDGGAFLALRTSTYEKVTQKLEGKNIFYEKIMSGNIKCIDFPDESPFTSLWMPEIIVPWIDKPEILNHKNGAVGLESIWFDSSLSNEFINFFTTLGFIANDNKIELTNGTLIFSGKKVPVNNRSITGVTVKVDAIDKIRKILDSMGIQHFQSGKKILLSPEYTFGIWLEFKE